MIEVKAPNKVPYNGRTPSVFLAGSIEMGAAIHWQDALAKMLLNDDVLLVNPRRDDWDSSWIQTKDNPQFREQVLWELNNLEMADIIVYCFDPNTKSPITLMELGLFAGDMKDIVVLCPEGFWRKGNVDLVCEKWEIAQVDTLEEVAGFIRSKADNLI